jgi:peptidoglycan pentaglycine glycine transferase (the first glycine)
MVERGVPTEYCQITSREEWNSALLALPSPHVLQSWDWGEVKRRHHWTPARLLWSTAERPVAAAQVLRRPLPHTPWGAMYVPKGPILDYTNDGLVTRVLADLEEVARRQRAIFCKVDPDVHPSGAQRALSVRGWRYSDEQIQFRNTALLDLTPTEQELLAAMKGKTRYNVRLAGRKGVTVRRGTVHDIPLFYAMYAETGKRDRFLVRPLDYYRDAWRVFLDAGLAHMLLAEAEGDIVAGLILFRFGQRAWFMYGASTDRHRNHMPNYALQWEAIRWARSAGCTVYDLWGAPDHLDEQDPMWGVWRFKEGLGAAFAPHIGAYDYPASRWLYWAYKIVLPRYLAWLRVQHT